MKTVRRRGGVLALLTLCSGLAIAEPVGAQTTVPAINTNEYLRLMACRCGNLSALAQLLEIPSTATWRCSRRNRT